MVSGFETHTLIPIDIQADNKLEILTCIRDSFEYMPGWRLDINVPEILGGKNPEYRFFTFDLTTKKFMWWRLNESFADTMDGDEVVIKDLADISNLLEFVFLNSENLRKSYTDPFATPYTITFKNSWKWEPGYPSVEQFKKVLTSKYKNHWMTYATEPGIGKTNIASYLASHYGIKPPDIIDADITDNEHETLACKASVATSKEQLASIDKEIAGLYGLNVDKLRFYIASCAAKLKKDEKVAAQWQKEKKNKELSSWQSWKVAKDKTHDGMPMYTYTKENMKTDKWNCEWLNEMLGEPTKAPLGTFVDDGGNPF